MAEIHHLRASNHKKNVDFPSHAVFPTLVIHPGGRHNLEKMFHSTGCPSDQSSDPQPTITGGPRGTAQVQFSSKPGDHKGEVIRSLGWVSYIYGHSREDSRAGNDHLMWSLCLALFFFFSTGDIWLSSGVALQGSPLSLGLNPSAADWAPSYLSLGKMG